MAAVGDGDRQALDECRFQFRHKRWNCSYVGGNATHIGLMPAIKTKEMAFYYALRSAAIAHAVATSCSQGNISGCGCDQTKIDGERLNPSDTNSTIKKLKGGKRNQGIQLPPQESVTEAPQGVGEAVEMKWGGCSVDVKHGVKYAREFLNSKETDQDSRALMNKQNNEAGLKILNDLVNTTCRCTGVSGSCTLKICWRTLPTLRLVGTRLAARYASPSKTRQVTPLRTDRAQRPKYLQVKSSKKPNEKPRKADLVYLDLSPNYCENDPSTGSMGTVGRVCDRASQGPEGCGALCCGRGYVTRPVMRVWQCNCTFKWCCTVTCRQCSQQTDVYTCN